jgi:hypothetical protein
MKIVNIKELRDYKRDNESYANFDGYEIETETDIIRLLISNYQACCETWGQITSADDLKEFIGAEILRLETVSSGDWTKSEIIKNKIDEYYDEVEAAFINIETDRGLLQLAVYNHHNGYYGHDILIESTAKVGETK